MTSRPDAAFSGPLGVRRFTCNHTKLAVVLSGAPYRHPAGSTPPGTGAEAS